VQPQHNAIQAPPHCVHQLFLAEFGRPARAQATTKSAWKPASDGASTLDVHSDTAAVDLATVCTLVRDLHVGFGLKLDEAVATALALAILHDAHAHNRPKATTTMQKAKGGGGVEPLGRGKQGQQRSGR